MRTELKMLYEIAELESGYGFSRNPISRVGLLYHESEHLSTDFKRPYKRCPLTNKQLKARAKSKAAKKARRRNHK